MSEKNYSCIKCINTGSFGKIYQTSLDNYVVKKIKELIDE